MAKDYKTEDGVRIAPLGELRDFEVAEGYPDIRGWRVDAADGREVGKVRELLIDIDTMRTRYLAVRLTQAIAASPGDREVLIPIGAAQVTDDHGKVVRLPLTSDRVGLLPLYDHSRLTRTHELEVRRHFTLGEAAAAAGTGVAAGAMANARDDKTERGFYDDDVYDDRRFFSSKRRANADDELARARANPRAESRDDLRAAREAKEVARDDARDIHLREGEIRVPVERDESVVLQRGEDGRDEIIIRRATGDTDVRRR